MQEINCFQYRGQLFTSNYFESVKKQTVISTVWTGAGQQLRITVIQGSFQVCMYEYDAERRTQPCCGQGQCGF